jgi:hypothetical protein
LDPVPRGPNPLPPQLVGWIAMPIIISCAHIAQAITKTMIYRTCDKSEGKLTVVFVNSADKREENEFYCKKCRQFAKSLKAAYRLQFTIVNSTDDSMENLIAFDEAIMPLIGCPASEFDEVSKLLQKDKKKKFHGDHFHY